MNVFAKFDEIPSMTLQDIKETKRYGQTFVRSVVRSDDVKTVYPPTNTVCRGYNNSGSSGDHSRCIPIWLRQNDQECHVIKEEMTQANFSVYIVVWMSEFLLLLSFYCMNCRLSNLRTQF